MKRILVLLLMSILCMQANAQTYLHDAYEPTPLYKVDNYVYTTAVEDIMLYHESDWFIASTPISDDGEWMIMYYDDVAPHPTMYVYFMLYDICYKHVVQHDSRLVTVTEAILNERDY